MTMTADANKSPAASKGMNTTAMIWAAIAVFVTVMGASTAIFGLAGLVAVMVPAALAMVLVLLRIVTEGM
ncbi:MAG: FecCD transport family [Roseibaca calidilacus]|uniref:FecCD transport family n=1 Tax=Roseibaca calidilacus TaxID=1666912 RepID=A0A0P7WRM8_9RHOB|nr:hypothetical protein [Roseibaca calidilacus]KPP89830.1 MAG: FecCD transport family [Roseibaca calidilacus]CUX80830.1 hypothetical protein Ga0058931_1367 [Roseibaca calidilacus]